MFCYKGENNMKNRKHGYCKPYTKCDCKEKSFGCGFDKCKKSCEICTSDCECTPKCECHRTFTSECEDDCDSCRIRRPHECECHRTCTSECNHDWDLSCMSECTSECDHDCVFNGASKCTPDCGCSFDPRDCCINHERGNSCGECFIGGIEEGYCQGYEEGLNNKCKNQYKCGYDEGYKIGFDAGYEKAKQEVQAYVNKVKKCRKKRCRCRC